MIGSTRYADRAEAGQVLAAELVRTVDPALLAGDPGGADPGGTDSVGADSVGADSVGADSDRAGPVVLALPRGGVPVAVPVAAALGTTVSVLVVRKLGAPGQPELAIGAIATIGNRVEQVLNTDWVRRLGLSDRRLARLIERETAVLQSRVTAFGSAPPVAGRVVIIVDDGLATGATMRAAVAAVRRAGASFVIAAAPVGAAEACHDLEQLADLVVCPRRPDPFRAVGEHYRDFAQVDDAEVARLLSS